jgi:hypothetical protein
MQQQKLRLEVEFFCPEPNNQNLPVLQSVETIEADTEVEAFEKLYKRNFVLEYCRNAYWRFKDVETRKRYFNWTAFLTTTADETGHPQF